MTAPSATKLITAAEFLEMDLDVPVELVLLSQELPGFGSPVANLFEGV